jgi:hypothetical protein
LQEDTYSIRQVADRLREFMYEERYVSEFGSAKYKPPLDFLIGGYSAGEHLAEEYHVVIEEGGFCPEPQLVSGAKDAEEQVFWGGQPEAINRIVAGYGEALPDVLAKDLGVPAAQIGPAMDVIEQRLSTPLIHAAMPIQDVIDLAEFFVNLAIGYSRFSPGASSVGGPIEIAAITKHESFKWVRRKHYFSAKFNPETL